MVGFRRDCGARFWKLKEENNNYNQPQEKITVTPIYRYGRDGDSDLRSTNDFEYHKRSMSVHVFWGLIWFHQY